ncbi:MAG: PEGA domain-containing protein [Candidatus Levybacteria bacterium]|nr:PEGA domain-containing protein [Candidatus Levybacteria bacterium]
MKKIILYIIPIILAFVVFLIIQFYISKNSGKGALQVTSTPKSAVYLNGKTIGQTPLCKCEMQDMIPVGDYTLRLVPENNSFPPFEERIKISKSVLTVVDRTFAGGASSEGEIISLTPLNNPKLLELLVVSIPDKAQILVDNNPVGNSPLLLKNLTESDHEVKIIKNGYKEKVVRIKTINGYKLVAEAFLGINQEVISISPTITPSVNPSLSLTPTPNLKQNLSVTPVSPSVLILQTPTGFLRVRDGPSLSGTEIARVYPTETYELVSEQTGWYKIKLKDGKTGWVSGQYAQKQ